MISSHTTHLVVRAKAIYDQRLQPEPESPHPDANKAIEPESGEHFLADSFGGEVAPARADHHDRTSLAMHIGHPAIPQSGGLTI